MQSMQKIDTPLTNNIVDNEQFEETRGIEVSLIANRIVYIELSTNINKKANLTINDNTTYFSPF